MPHTHKKKIGLYTIINCGRQTFCFFLLSIMMFLIPFNRIWILASYHLNQTYIAQNLCENRDKPQLQCHGKCFLKKQLEKEDSSEKAKMLRILLEKGEILYCHNLNNYLFSSPYLLLIYPLVQHKSHYNPIYSADYSNAIFHPPPVV
jgi:hypothetical protein